MQCKNKREGSRSELFSPWPFASDTRTPKTHSSFRGTPTLTTVLVKNANTIQNASVLSVSIPSTGIINKKDRYKTCLFVYDPYGNRTHVTAVKGPCLNRLTNGPDKWWRKWDLNLWPAGYEPDALASELFRHLLAQRLTIIAQEYLLVKRFFQKNQKNF